MFALGGTAPAPNRLSTRHQVRPLAGRMTGSSGYPVRCGFSTNRRRRWNTDRRSSRAMTVLDGALRTQRVGILDHIGSAAGGGAGGKQHEARRREHPGRKIYAQRKLVRDILV